jgi:hypothetical protein
MLVFGLLDAVQAHAGVLRVQLQVKRCGLDSLLLVTRQPCQAVGKGVSYTKIHKTITTIEISQSRFCSLQ